MKKNIKFLLMIMTLFISIMLFTNKVGAIVMWMQCTDSPNTKISDEKIVYYYSSFAVINNKADANIRNLVYDSTGFYNSKKPTYIMNRKHNGGYDGDFCWYGTKYDSNDSDAHGDFNQCDKSSDIVSISELLNGVCPTYLVTAADGILWLSDTAGSIQKDMLVMAGKKDASDTESLNESHFVIYKFKDNSDNSGVMIEGYNSSGLYGYATTWNDWDSFTENLNMPEKNDTNDLISDEGGYSKKYMSWAASTQARRIAKFGRNYFKLLDNSRPWLVGAMDDQKFTVDESLIFKSDDSNDAFLDYVSDWYIEYEDKLSEQLNAMEELQSSKYKKVFEVAEKIDVAVVEGKKYTFTEDYNVSQMVIDLENAYNELDKILSSGGDSFYDSYDSNCRLTTDNKTDDALASIHTKFVCEVFGVSSISNLPYVVNDGFLDEFVASALSNAIDEYSKSGISLMTLQSTAQEYAKLFTTAIKYIRTYEAVTGETQQIVSTLVDDYSTMSSYFGSEVIVSCEDLIDEDLREEIKSYLNIVKIAVPIILILFGVIEFTKAIFAGDEEQMKKAQKNFIIRLAIAVIFFLTPTIVDFLLGIANKVWNFIEPGSCGIFE